MTTAPFLPDSEQLLDQMLSDVVRARATHRTFAAELDLVDASSAVRLDYDETRAPAVTATLECVLPATKAELDRLDPRQGVRVELDLGWVRPDGTEDVQTIADLGLRRVVPHYATETMTLTLASDEAMVVDASPVAVGKVDTATHADGIVQLLGESISPAPDFVQVGPVGGPAKVDPVNDRWATAQDLADAIGSRLYDDGLRTFRLEPTPTLAGTPDVTLATGPGGLVLEPEASLSRDDWFNYVCLRYSWRNTAGGDSVVTATSYVADGPFAITDPNAGKRILLDERRVATTQNRANLAAATVLRRQMSKSRAFTFDAVAAYWVRPGMTAAVTLPGGGQELHLVSRVSFAPLAGTMSVATRLPENWTLATTTPPPPAPTDPTPPPVADPPPPVRLTYVTEWVANASQAYRSDGQPNTFLGDRLAQGYAPGSVNGNQRSLALFTGTSRAVTGKRSEVGKTTAQALAGAIVQRVQVQLVPTHTYSSSGATLRVGWSALFDAIPPTLRTTRIRAEAKGCKKNTPRWVDLTSTELCQALESGSNLSVYLGPGRDTNPGYYALVAAHNYATTSWRPVVRITYTK